MLRIQLKFWWIAMGVKYNHTKFEQETQHYLARTGFANGLGFKICQKRPKTALLGAVWVSRMSMEDAICFGTNLDDEQTPVL